MLAFRLPRTLGHEPYHGGHLGDSSHIVTFGKNTQKKPGVPEILYFVSSNV